MGEWSGSLKQLGELEANLTRLSKVVSRASKAIAERLSDLMLEEFAASSNPYGDEWAVLSAATVKRKRGNDIPLIRSGKMMDSISVKPAKGAGVVIRVENYAAFHQMGTKHMPQRQILPSDGMPEKWEQAIQEEIEALVTAKKR